MGTIVLDRIATSAELHLDTDTRFRDRLRDRLAQNPGYRRVREALHHPEVGDRWVWPGRRYTDGPARGLPTESWAAQALADEQRRAEAVSMLHLFHDELDSGNPDPAVLARALTGPDGNGFVPPVLEFDIDPQILTTWAEIDNPVVRHVLRFHRVTPTPILERLTADMTYREARSLLQRPDVSPAAIDVLGARKHTPLRDLFIDPSTPTRIGYSAEAGDAYLRHFEQIMAERRQVAAERRTRREANKLVRAQQRALLHDTGEREQKLRSWAEDDDDTLREQAANRPATPDDCITQLATDPSIWVRRAVAGRTHLPQSVTAALASDPDPSVRRTLAENLRIPLPDEPDLAADPDDGVRAAVEERQNPGTCEGG